MARRTSSASIRRNSSMAAAWVSDGLFRFSSARISRKSGDCGLLDIIRLRRVMPRKDHVTSVDFSLRLILFHHVDDQPILFVADLLKLPLLLIVG